MNEFSDKSSYLSVIAHRTTKKKVARVFLTVLWESLR
jgi:hypothetical protein